ncbi:NAD(+) diphosphatase [Corynebacterium epidermidicanis]|uniref:NAD(+) diphosphatase n=1 Tax=Corynebacterium epidermidicanis TaxID=1050174 RepID=A0A0G3GMV6_9CORY|nr:NUDIX domain-containing protein [Corynebacterium epidermidicanis]AKK02561.1 NUDIX family protein [Corynebacterium epidermidicanis]
MQVLVITPDNRTLVTDKGAPLWFDGAAIDVAKQECPDGLEGAVRRDVTTAQQLATRFGAQLKSIRALSDDPRVARAAHLLRFRESHRFHPHSGKLLTHQADQARDPHGVAVFPRIDPCVIGIVELEGHDRILLGRNAQRPQFFSLVAGYVCPGETLEQCFAREVLEETGRSVHQMTYQGSQPWPMSGSLMMAFHAFTTDVHPRQTPDGELIEIRWASREQLATLPLAAPGSIARKLIDDWSHTCD